MYPFLIHNSLILSSDHVSLHRKIVLILKWVWEYRLGVKADLEVKWESKTEGERLIIKKNLRQNYVTLIYVSG